MTTEEGLIAQFKTASSKLATWEPDPNDPLSQAVLEHIKDYFKTTKDPTVGDCVDKLFQKSVFNPTPPDAEWQKAAKQFVKGVLNEKDNKDVFDQCSKSGKASYKNVFLRALSTVVTAAVTIAIAVGMTYLGAGHVFALGLAGSTIVGQVKEMVSSGASVLGFTSSKTGTKVGGIVEELLARRRRGVDFRKMHGVLGPATAAIKASRGASGQTK